MMRAPNSCVEERAALPQQRLGRSILKMYYVNPALVGPSENWKTRLEWCRAVGFDYVACAPLFAPGRSGDVFLAGDIDAAHPILQVDSADQAVHELAGACAAHQLSLIIDIVLDRADSGGRLAVEHPGMFDVRAPHATSIDPRSAWPRFDTAYARTDRREIAERLVALWAHRLRRLLEAGAAGFRFLNPQSLSADLWLKLHAHLRDMSTSYLSLAWTPGLSWPQIEGLRGAGFDGVFSSMAWWDRRASWFVEELDILRRIAPVIGCPEAPFGQRLAARVPVGLDLANAYRQALRISAATGAGLLVPMGFEFAACQPIDPRRSMPEDFDDARDLGRDLSEDIRAANALVDRIGRMGIAGEIRGLTDPDDPTTALVRFDAPDARRSRDAVVVLINPDLREPRVADVELDPATPVAGVPLGNAAPFDGPNDLSAPLGPGEVRLVTVARTPHVTSRGRRERQAREAANKAPRIIIDQISPVVDGGRFATKRLAGERVAVEADIFADGHGVIGAELMWRAADETDWRRVPMRLRDNDRWFGAFDAARVGRHYFTIEAWLDEFGSLCRDLDIKWRAGVDFSLEIEAARRLVTAAAARAEGSAKGLLSEVLARLASAPAEQAPDILLATEIRDAIGVAAERAFRLRHAPAIPLEVERPQAGFAAWYELFPRSAGRDPGRHGTFDDVIARLPAIRQMGFDVLYLPPIHPIGRTNRKGRNNSLTAEPGEPGSPYAIGSHEGGHDAIHPQLGTLDDFRRLVAAAADNGLEIALDFAIQCSPDHPWLRQHRNWFRWRPDGSLRFAENPPKKYEDIVNVEFYADGATAELWAALRDVVLFWIEQGVRIFRVDNPHTKPLPFWEWLIADLRARHPDVILLSEAFTRPKMMYRLAKVGFSQSYTYFTWRNTKQELSEYLAELTATAVADYFRPHFFVNTPDINPYFLQHSGRAGFLTRAALAATLSGLWGMYSGFEQCEAAPLPGREEYLDSEKYEIRLRLARTPGDIVEEIAKLNRIRKAHPALQSHRGLKFYNAYNDQIIVYGKMHRSHRDMVLVAVSLDPHHPQEATFELPLWEWGLPDDGSLSVADLMRDRHFVWTGKLQRVRLDPAALPFAIWRIARLSGQGS